MKLIGFRSRLDAGGSFIVGKKIRTGNGGTWDQSSGVKGGDKGKREKELNILHEQLAAEKRQREEVFH